MLDEKVTAMMAEAARITADSRVLEIGPGLGILTGELLRRGAEVVAVELDRRFANFVAEKFAGQKLRVETGDIHEFSNRRIASLFAAPGEAYSVVANLPYSVTTAVLEKFMFEEPKPTSVTVMVQREVADRILAKPGDMSSLAVMVQALGEPRRVINVPADSFFPAPKVNSTVIHIRVKNPTELAAFFGGLSSEIFFRVVRAAFAAKRQQLRNSLSSLSRDKKLLEISLIEAKINPHARPEELTLGQWVSLTLALGKPLKNF
ncbi:MAG: 16S rRNA (adenine(1518)-N(6)/adenine(1519)-N(6))-dimethyltransferase RsmA [Patescibacteria group bacterium]|nr:16S rRNA (adenine(1518)-N(6)/adenine(1519)-N(6))-dimethyltransferase RsmA [Patescibacteria group bacterium]